MSVTRVRTALENQWEQLAQQMKKWGKLLDGCIDTWKMCLDVQEELTDLEQWISEWDSPADNQSMLEQHSDMLVSPRASPWVYLYMHYQAGRACKRLTNNIIMGWYNYGWTFPLGVGEVIPNPASITTSVLISFIFC